jgi:geranylgeranyl diphosphate synthase, type III
MASNSSNHNSGTEPSQQQQQQQQQEEEVEEQKQHQQQQKQRQHQQHQLDPSLFEPFYYITSVPGKNVRGILIDCFQVWFQVDNVDVLETIKDIIGDLHNASLLVDDIEDNSRLRRGIPVAHAIFGIPTVLNCANYVYFLALQKCQSLHNTKAMEIFIQEILNLHRGQGYDIQWREMSCCPTEEEYIHMVQDKTGGLFRLAVGLMQAFATQYQTDDFTQLVNHLGLYFQIRDDYINLADEEYFKSKSFCEDITEGKFSYPIVHCINTTTSNTSSSTSSISTTTGANTTAGTNRSKNNNKNHRLLSILKQRTEDVEVKRYAQTLLKDSGSLDYTRMKCKSLKQEITQEVQKFGNNPMLLHLLDKLQVQLDQLDDDSKIDGKNNRITTSQIDEP